MINKLPQQFLSRKKFLRKKLWDRVSLILRRKKGLHRRSSCLVI